MNSKRKPNRSLLIGVCMLTIASFATPRTAKSAIIMYPDVGLGLTLMGLGVLAVLGDVEDVGEALLYWGIVLDEDDKSVGINLKKVRRELRYSNLATKVQEQIVNDLLRIEKATTGEELDLPMPKELEAYFKGRSTPSTEALEKLECQYVKETQKKISDFVWKFEEKDAGITTSKEERLPEISVATVKYLLEKWPSGFETDLTIEELKNCS